MQKYTLEILPHGIHVYRFHDMKNETWDEWVKHRREYRVTIPDEYLDLNLLDIRCGSPTPHAAKVVANLARTAKRTRYLYAVLGNPGLTIELIRLIAFAANWSNIGERVQSFTNEQDALEWLIYRATQIHQRFRTDSDIHIGSLALNIKQRSAHLLDQRLILTPLEFDVLAYLAQNVGRTVSHDELLQAIWKHDAQTGGTKNQLKSCIKRLRKKLGDVTHAVSIISVRGYGYRIEAVES